MTSKKEQLVQNILSSHKADPGIGSIDWDALMEDQDTFESMMSIVVKSYGSKQKTKISKSDGIKALNAASGVYSNAPFSKAFSVLLGDETIRRSAKKIGISPAFVYNLKSGKAVPSIEIIETIAKAYKVHPSYFSEYRMFYILLTMKQFLSSNPEVMSSWFYNIKKKEV